MPIRHCQKCGLKVLIDESQSTANPFYCQRCSASLKASPPGPSESDPGASKGGPIKILCPYCKASFNGRLPGKPAKGKCPICRKELVLLPTGQVRPAATFDLSKWQQEGQDSGPSPMPEPMGETASPDAPIRIGDDLPKPPTPVPAGPYEKTKKRASEISTDPTIALNASAPATEEAPVSTETAPEASSSAPEPARPPEPVRRPTSRPPLRSPRPLGAPASAFIPQTTSSGKVFLAIILFLLPLIAGGVGYALKDKALKTLLDKVGGIGARGFLAIYKKLAPPPPPPKEEPKKEEPRYEPPKKEEQVVDPQQQEKQAVNDAYNKYRRKLRDRNSLFKTATEADKASEDFKKIEAELKDYENKYLQAREKYKTDWKVDYDPSKAGLEGD